MRVLRFLLYKEFMQIIRNKVMLRFILIMPMMLLLVLPWALSFEQKDIKLGIVNLDKSTTSEKLIQQIISNHYFHLADYSPVYSQSLQKMDKGEVDIILTIPKNFEKSIVLQQNPQLFVTIDALNGMKGNIISSYLTQILQDYNLKIAESGGISKGIQQKIFFRYNTHMKYQDFMVPGILVILMSLIGGLMTSLNIVKEKEIGTIDQINVTPLSKIYFILGKLIPFWIIGMIILTLGILVSYFVYGLFPAEGLSNLYLFAFCYMVAFSGFGIIISNITDNQQQAILTIFFFIMIFILLSGLFTPITSMPNWAQKLTIINPFRYFVEVMRILYLKGGGFYEILPNLKIILIFALVLNSLAVFTYKKTN